MSQNIRIPCAGRSCLCIPKTSLIIKHIDFLKRVHTLACTNDVDRLIVLLQKASLEEIQTLCELSHNALQGQYPATRDRIRKRLAPVKTLLRKLAAPKTPLASKKKRLIREVSSQRGGLPLIPLLTPIISSLIGSALGAAIKGT